MHFTLHPKPDTPSYWFVLQADNGRIPLRSPLFPGRRTAMEAAKSAVLSLRDEQVANADFLIEDESGIAIRLDSSHEIGIAQSNYYTSPEAIRSAIDQLRAEAATQAEFGITIEPKSTYRPLERVALESPQYDRSILQTGREVIYSRTLPHTVRFQLSRLEKEGRYYFLFKDANNLSFLFSPAFTSSVSRDRHLGPVVTSAAHHYRYEKRRDGEAYFFILQTRNGVELARSRNFTDEREMDRLIAGFAREAPWWEEELQRVYLPRRRSGIRITPFNSAYPSRSGLAGFETFENTETRQPRYFFQLNDAEGRPLLFSHAYATDAGRANGIRSVIRNLPVEEHYLIRKEEEGYYFLILAGNRQEIARSRYFDTREALDRQVEWLEAGAREWAATYQVDLESTYLRADTERFALVLEAPGRQTAPAGRAPVKDSSRKTAWYWPALVILLAAALLWALFGRSNAAAEQQSPAVAAPDTVFVREFAPEGFAAYYAAEPLYLDTAMTRIPEASTGQRGPGAVAFGYWLGTTEGRFANFLSQEQPAVPQAFIMNKVKFPEGRAQLDDTAEIQVKHVSIVLENYPQTAVEIIGYAGPEEESPKAASALARERARKVFNLLKNMGISPGRMSFAGEIAERQENAEDKPAMDRRVELRVTRYTRGG